MKFDFENKLIFSKYPDYITKHINYETKFIKQQTQESKAIIHKLKKASFNIGRISGSIYFLMFLFAIQSFFLRQNLEYKQKSYLSS